MFNNGKKYQLSIAVTPFNEPEFQYVKNNGLYAHCRALMATPTKLGVSHVQHDGRGPSPDDESYSYEAEIKLANGVEPDQLIDDIKRKLGQHFGRDYKPDDFIVTCEPIQKQKSVV